VILEFSELKPNLHNQVKNWNKNEGKNLESNIPIPSYVLKSKNNKIDTLYKKNFKTIVVAEIEKKGNKIGKEREAELSLEINSQLKVSLKLKYKNKKHEIPRPKFDTNKVVEELLSKVDKAANLAQFQIPLTFKDTTKYERKTFFKDFLLKDISLTEIGKFSKINLKSINIFPANFSSAKKWAKELIIDQISTYVLEDELKDIEDRIIKKNEFNRYKIDLFLRKELLEDISFGTEKYWFLQAPNDLELEKVIS
jgi:hypothetical protein